MPKASNFRHACSGGRGAIPSEKLQKAVDGGGSLPARRSVALVAKLGQRIREGGEGLVLAALAFGLGLARHWLWSLGLGRKAALAGAKLEQADRVGDRQAHAGQGGGGALLVSPAAPGANVVCLGHSMILQILLRFCATQISQAGQGARLTESSDRWRVPPRRCSRVARHAPKARRGERRRGGLAPPRRESRARAGRPPPTRLRTAQA